MMPNAKIIFPKIKAMQKLIRKRNQGRVYFFSFSFFVDVLPRAISIRFVSRASILAFFRRLFAFFLLGLDLY
jgi:hypothetical protein